MTKRKFVLATRERPSFANNQATTKIRLQKSKGGGAAALDPATERQDSAQAALHANGRARALPAPPIALKRCTSHAGHNAGGDDARTARERVRNPPARTALAPLSGSHLESALR